MVVHLSNVVLGCRLRTVLVACSCVFSAAGGVGPLYGLEKDMWNTGYIFFELGGSLS